jgi:hypothetical protein
MFDFNRPDWSSSISKRDEITFDAASCGVWNFGSHFSCAAKIAWVFLIPPRCQPGSDFAFVHRFHAGQERLLVSSGNPSSGVCSVEVLKTFGYAVNNVLEIHEQPPI